MLATAWKRHQTHLQGRPSETLTSSRLTAPFLARPRKPSVPRRGLSRWRDLVRRRSQFDSGSHRGRLPTSLVYSFVRIGKSSAQVRRSNPTPMGSGTMTQRDVTGSCVPNVVPQQRASLVCPSSASGSGGLAEQARQLCHGILLATPQHFPPHRTFTKAEVWCGGKMRHAPASEVERSAREHAGLVEYFPFTPQMIHRAAQLRRQDRQRLGLAVLLLFAQHPGLGAFAVA